MIVCDISHAGRYKSLSNGLCKAIEWLEANRNTKFEKGVYNISDDGRITAKCEEPHLRSQEVSDLEAHRRFIDIHVPLKNGETIGWAPIEGLKHPHGEYDPEHDIMFYGDSATGLIQVRVGDMAVFFPEDAHAPNIGLGTHRKLCIKIPVDE